MSISDHFLDRLLDVWSESGGAEHPDRTNLLRVDWPALAAALDALAAARDRSSP